MFATDTITKDGKKAILDLLDQLFEMEYKFVVNYPRLIDRLTSVDHIPIESIPQSLEDLSTDSARHLALTAQLSRELGGEPRWRIAIESIDDSSSMFNQQMAREALALSLLRKAKDVAEQNQVEGLSGILWSMRTIGGIFSHDSVTRTTAIRLLEEMANDEERHIDLLQNAISQLNIHPQK